MAQPRIQASFNSGEWAPQLYARVDMERYRSAAALLRNVFVDYRGGVSTRAGTKYILQAYKSSKAVRLIPFQASFTVGYVIEAGDFYMRFYNNGAPVLETGIAITGATKANPCVLSVVNTWSVGDWVYITGVAGMTQLNNNYYQISARSGTTITLADLNGNAIDSTAYGTYISGGLAQRVYTITTPYAAGDLSLLKFAQNASEMIFCHPNYVPYSLTITTATSWALTAITFGSTATTPTGIGAATTLGAGSVNYAYVVTSVDSNGQESAPSAFATLASKLDLRTTSGTNTISWSAAAGAVSYNVYKAELSYAGAVPSGSLFGFAGNVTGTSFIDSNIAPDFTLTPPIAQNPFLGSGVASTAVTTPGSYTSVPTVTFAPPGAGSTATGNAIMIANSVGVNTAGINYHVGDVLTFYAGLLVSVLTVDVFGGITSLSVISYGYPTSSIPGSPLAPISTTGVGTRFIADVTWGVSFISLSSSGTGYGGAPAITFSPAGAVATATIGAPSLGNPSVPSFFQQRLVLADQTLAAQTFRMSQTGSQFNFDISNPVQSNDAITGTLVSGQLQEIKSMVSMPNGLIVFTNSGTWLLNGGSAGSAVTPSAIVANAQSYIGANDMPPIVANFDILFVQAKGAVVRDTTFNFYANIFTGTDISVLSSHLFYGYTLQEWCWAEEPFKLVYAVRSDGTMLTLTFLKEQELIAWAHSDTTGLFKSVATITEAVSTGTINGIYTVVQRTVNGNLVQYIERFAERIFPSGASDAWCVDAGLQYRGVPATSFTGAQHLAGMTCTGLADGVEIPAFVMPTTGNFTLASAASVVTVGLGFTAQIKTMALDMGEPTVQSKVKKINAVDVRVDQTLGLKIGSSFSRLVPMKDLVVGAVGSMLTGQDVQLVSGLFSGDTRTFLDPTYTVPGQYCIQQDKPFPATILGVIPQISVGDTPK